MAKSRRKLVAWSRDDVKNLRALAKSRLSGTQAAKKLKRSAGAVAQKAMKLKIRFRSVRRKGVQCASPSLAGDCPPSLTLLTSQVIDAPLRRRHDPLRHQ